MGMQFHLNYWALSDQLIGPPEYEPVCQVIEADSFIEALQEMQDWLDIERAFQPVIFGSLTMMNTAVEDAVLPRTA